MLSLRPRVAGSGVVYAVVDPSGSVHRPHGTPEAARRQREIGQSRGAYGCGVKPKTALIITDLSQIAATAI